MQKRFFSVTGANKSVPIPPDLLLNANELVTSAALALLIPFAMLSVGGLIVGGLIIVAVIPEAPQELATSLIQSDSEHIRRIIEYRVEIPQTFSLIREAIIAFNTGLDTFDYSANSTGWIEMMNMQINSRLQSLQSTNHLFNLELSSVNNMLNINPSFLRNLDPSFLGTRGIIVNSYIQLIEALQDILNNPRLPPNSVNFLSPWVDILYDEVDLFLNRFNRIAAIIILYAEIHIYRNILPRRTS